ncbi:MAG: hypothetical protein H0V45_11085 [Actinobacteria bacterium]|nr:hypothetical protein [Actinomycetota bacterium]
MSPALASVDAYLEGKNEDAVRLFRRFQQLVQRCGPSEASPHSTIVYWKRRRVFAGAYVQGRRLELNIDLLREAEHHCLLAAFPTTKKVVTHRLRVTETGQLDESIEALLQEAYAEVGPGTRGRLD